LPPAVVLGEAGDGGGGGGQRRPLWLPPLGGPSPGLAGPPPGLPPLGGGAGVLPPDGGRMMPRPRVELSASDHGPDASRGLDTSRGLDAFSPAGRIFTLAPPPSGGRSGGGRRSADSSFDPHAPAPADGRRTQVAAFNTGPAWDNLQVDTQAEGQEPRGVPLGIPPLAQVIFEMGFGLGRAGGEGWARLSTTVMPVAAAFYGYRLSTGEEAATETWAAPAWRYGKAGSAGEGNAGPGPGPRTIGLPAPAARHDYWEQRDADAPVARIALQNLGPAPARVAVDSYDALCGYNGSRELTLPPLEARLLPVDELPGARWRDISAVVRVLEGEAAVQLEVARSRTFPIRDFPLDRAEALLGTPILSAMPPPVVRAALLELTPPLISIPRPSAPMTATVTLRDSIRSGRCLSFTASSSAPWLLLPAWDGLLPADLQLTIDPATMPAGRQVAELTVRVMEDGVLGNPGKVTVVVEAAAARPTVWLPRLGK
ncbi:MAG TPA: hypothetical protein PK826_15320, partial [Anaerolineae bacterium]|nr:hypothetical protein [Anaerolineae bacterium]